jgi:cytochrome c oxidase subunit 4
MAQSPQQQVAQQRQAAHPTPMTYAKVATSLVLLTMIEVAILYVDALNDIVIPIFFALSIVKFALVALFYMHLKFDARLFSWFFVGGLTLATAVILGLIALFKTIFV